MPVDSFLDLTRQHRYEALKAELAGDLEREWTWEGLYTLLEALGITRVNDYLQAGWWAPVRALKDPDLAGRLTRRVERALADGRLPDPGQPYTWEQIRQTAEICELSPMDLVDTLVWVYALTQGEDMFKHTLRMVPSSRQGSGSSYPGRP